MPITMLDTVEFSKIACLGLVIPVVGADPSGYEAGFIYNSAEKLIKFHNGTAWTAAISVGYAAGGVLTGTYPNPGLAASVVNDTHVSAAAGIATAKINGLDAALTARALTTRLLTAGAGLTGGGDLSTDRTFDIGQGTGITVNANDVALNTAYTNGLYLTLTGGTLSNFLTLHADPTSDMHAANKRYVDLVSQGYSGKNAVRAVATTNVTQSGTQTIDGVALIATQRVLCTGQSTASQNGIWVVAAGAWTRATDMDASGELVDGTLVPVAEGTTWGDSVFICTSISASPWVPGTTTSTWTRQSGLADLVAGNGMTKTGNQIDVVSANTAHMTVGTDSITIVSAPKLETGRTVTLTGDVTGTSGAFDGTANISYSTAIAAGVIVDADVNASAAIAQSKIANLTTDLGLKAPLASPALTGTPTVPTAAADTNTTQAASTAFVVGQAATVASPMDGTATVGTSLKYARQDHIHATDTSRAPLNAPALTGVPTAPTAAVDTNTTQIATTAFVVAQAASVAPVMDGTQTLGTSLKYARQDHVHASDTSRIANALLTTKGDIIAATAASTPARLAVGTNNQVLTADSAQPSGVKWATPATGLLKYTADLGAITGGTGLVVTHSLGTKDLTVAVYRIGTPYDVVFCGVEMTSTTTVTLKFALSYSANTFRVVITG